MQFHYHRTYCGPLQAERTRRVQTISARMAQAGAHYVIETIADLPAVLDAIEEQLRQGQ